MRARRLVFYLVTWLVAWLVVLATASPRAFAQSASVQAQSLFEEGRKLLQAGKIAEACASFESSQKLDPAVTTLLNLADCREQNHQLATAWGTFTDANRMARAANNDKLARVASNHAQKLAPRLSKLTVNIPTDRQVPGLEILRDNEPINPAGWNHALPIDGGTYTITARAPGRAPWSTTKTIKVESDTQSVEIPKLAEAKPGAPVAASRPGSPGGASPATTAPAGTPPGVATSAGAAGGAPSSAKPATGSPVGAPPVAPSRPGSSGGAEPPAPGSRSVATTTPDPMTPPAIDRPESRRSYGLPIAFGAGALALGGAALGFHLWGNSTYDQAKAEMVDQGKRNDLESSANTRRHVAQGFGIAAIGCAGAAVFLFIRGGGGESHAATMAMTPVASPQFSGLTVAGSW